jgi:hypothetical protein
MNEGFEGMHEKFEGVNERLERLDRGKFLHKGDARAAKLPVAINMDEHLAGHGLLVKEGSLYYVLSAAHVLIDLTTGKIGSLHSSGERAIALKWKSLPFTLRRSTLRKEPVILVWHRSHSAFLWMSTAWKWTFYLLSTLLDAALLVMGVYK